MTRPILDADAEGFIQPGKAEFLDQLQHALGNFFGVSSEQCSSSTPNSSPRAEPACRYRALGLQQYRDLFEQFVAGDMAAGIVDDLNWSISR